MRLLVVFLLMALIVLPTEGLFRRRRRRRWLRVRGSRVLTGLAVASRLGLIGKREAQDDLFSADLNEDGNIDQSEAENLFDKRDAEEIMQSADIDGDSVVSHEEFIRGAEDFFSQHAE
ncbi:calcium-binding protein 5-like [Haliotis rufescens]|uniref:calcium-binding protein 5-like n=1 Tax=Haliotis rufescens TaxID=6454 RepID=UPI001EB05317|nr:calcium-binding protein 5-like [Haliotis rufescens]